MQFSIVIREVKAADPDASKVQPLPCSGADRVSVGATCDTAGATLTYRLIFVSGTLTVVGVSSQFTLRASSAADWGAIFLGVPDDEYQNPPCMAAADNVFVKIDTVSGGNWSLAALALFPPGVQKPL